MKWEVQIAGSNTDLDDLCAVFTSDAMRLECRSDGYFLTSSQFEALTNPHEVESRASQLVSMLSGAASLSLGSRSVLKTSGVTRIDENGRRYITMLVSGTMHINSRAMLEVTNADGTMTRILPASNAPGWVTAAISNSVVAKALRLFGTGADSWVDLYRILEVIIQDLGRAKFLQRGWITSQKLSVFTHTANSVSAIGDSARHGAEHTTPPSKPMSLGEAKSLVSVILHSWLQEKN